MKEIIGFAGMPVEEAVSRLRKTENFDETEFFQFTDVFQDLEKMEWVRGDGGCPDGARVDSIFIFSRQDYIDVILHGLAELPDWDERTAIIVVQNEFSDYWEEEEGDEEDEGDEEGEEKILF